MADRRVDIVLSARDEATRALRNVSGAIEGLKRPVAALGGVLAALGVQRAVQGFDALATKAQTVTDLRNGFETLTNRIGENADVMLGTLRPATRNLIEDMDLMKLTNQAIILDLPVTAKSMGSLAQDAVKLGRAMGVDARTALESVIVGIGRQSRLWLDNIGIVVDVETVNRNAAKALGKTADELTDSEKKLAFYNATVGAARKAAAGLGDETETLGEKWAQFKTIIGNVVSQTLDQINRSVEGISESISPEDFERATKQVVAGLLGVAEAGLVAVRVLANVAGGILAITRDLTEGGDPRFFGHLRDFAAGQPGYIKAIDELGDSISEARAKLEGSAAPAKKFREEMGAVAPTAREAASGLEDFSAAGTVAFGIIGTLGVSAIGKFIGSARKGADALLTVAAGGDKIAAEVFRSASAMEAFTLATVGSKVAIGGVVLAVGGIAYELTRAILVATGFDSKLKQIADRKLNSGADAERAFQELRENVDYIEKARKALSEKGFEIPFDDSSLLAARNKLKTFDWGNAAGKIKMAADTTEFRADIAEARDEFTKFLQLSRFNPGEFERLWAESAKGATNLGDRLEFVEKGLAGIGPAAKKAAAEAGNPLEALNELLKSLKLPEFKPDATSEAKRLADALRLIGQIRPTIKTDEARRQLDDLRKQIERIQDVSTRVSVAAKAAGFDEVLKRADEIREKTEALNALKLEGPQPEAVEQHMANLARQLDDMRVEFLKGIPAPKLIGLDEATGRRLLFRAELEKGGLKGMDVAERDAQQAVTRLNALLSLRGVPNVDPKWLEVSIQQAYEAAQKAVEGTSITLPINVEDPLAKLDLVKVGDDLSEGWAEAFPVETVLTMEEVVGRLANEGLPALDAALGQTGVHVESLADTMERTLLGVGIDGALAFGDTLAAAALEGGKAFRGFFRDLMRSLAAAIARALVLKAILSFFGGGGGGAAAGSGVAAGGGAIALATGGFPGGREAAAPINVRSGFVVPGIDRGRDEIPAILRPTELTLDAVTSRKVVERAHAAGVGAVTGPSGIGLTPQFRKFLADGMGPTGERVMRAAQRIRVPVAVQGAAVVPSSGAAARSRSSVARVVALATGGFPRGGLPAGGLTRGDVPTGAAIEPPMRPGDALTLRAVLPPASRNSVRSEFSTQVIERIVQLAPAPAARERSVSPVDAKEIANAVSDAVAKRLAGMSIKASVDVNPRGDLLQRIFSDVLLRINQGTIDVPATRIVDTRSRRT